MRDADFKRFRAAAVVAAAFVVFASGCTGSAHASGVDSAARTRDSISPWPQPSGTGPIETDPPAPTSEGRNLTLTEGGRTDTRYDDSTLYVEAGEPGSTSIVGNPGMVAVGRRVRCAYHAVGGASNELTWDITSPTIPTAGGLYVLRCIHPDDGTDLNGYPMLVVFTPGNPLPGGAVGVEEVAKFAVDSEVFESPRPVLSPPDRQIVGVDTWLAVSSRLAYPDVSAQAGNAWVTVRPVLREAVWDFGNGESMRCSADIDKLWDPAVSGTGQSTQCSHLFERISGRAGRDGSVAVSWTIYEITYQHPSTWTIWGVVTLRSPVVFNVTELQSTIR